MKRATVAAAVMVAMFANAAPAGAHTLTGVAASNFHSAVTGVAPPTPAIRVRLLDLGRRVELRNRGSSEVTILGYDDEPYLRVGRRSVYENVRSRAHFLNQPQPAAFTTTTLPPIANDATPDWRKRSGSDTVRWRDRRTRWEGSTPPVVQVAPNQRHVVSRWTIAILAGDRPVTVTGTITWVPGPGARPWLIVAAWAALLTVACTRLQKFGPPLAAMAAVLVVADVAHTIGQVGASREALLILAGRVALSGVFSVAAWVTVAVAIPSLARGNDAALIAVGLAAFFITMFTGVGDASSLTHSQIPSLLSPAVVRALLAICLGAGAGLTVATLVIGRRVRWWAERRAPVLEP